MISRIRLAVALAAIMLMGGCASTTPKPISAVVYNFDYLQVPVKAKTTVVVADLEPIQLIPIPATAAPAVAIAAPDILVAPTIAGDGRSPIRTASYGSCDCPYDRKSSGAICGAASAWSKPGGKSPQCYSTDPPPSYSFQPSCAENGSCYGDISAATGKAKTVRVGGYFRKDGTYVRGHFRSK